MVMGFAKSSTHPTDPFLGIDRLVGSLQQTQERCLECRCSLAVAFQVGADRRWTDVEANCHRFVAVAETDPR
jgi:hypothetical protein